MTYTINKTDGNELTKVPDGTLDTSTTALTLIGRNSTSFGESVNENFIKLLENFASTTAPENAIKGQIWFDTSTNRLNVYDGSGFRATGGPQVSARVPDPLTTGDLWINNETNQMYMYDGTDLTLVGPIYTAAQGVTGFKIPGYGPVTKPVKIGFNAANLSDIKFDVVVTRSESILLEDGVTAKTASELVFNNEENTFTQRMFVQNNDGIDIGAASQARQYVSSNDFIIENQIENRAVKINVKSGSTTVAGITVTGNGQKVGIFNDSPTADKNITLGNTTVPTNLTADGGGITLKGDTDKTITYNRVDQTWNLSENLKLASGKTFSIGNDEIVAPNGLNAYVLGPAVTVSSLVTVGNLTALQMSGSVTSGINITDGTISLANGSIGLFPVNGSVVLNDRRITNLANPQSEQDATTKSYVDLAVFLRGMSMSMDITGLEVSPGVVDNTAIAAILNEIAPFYVANGTPEQQQGVAINGTILKLHCTTTTVTNADITYSPSVATGEFTLAEVSTPTGTAEVVRCLGVFRRFLTERL